MGKSAPNVCLPVRLARILTDAHLAWKINFYMRIIVEGNVQGLYMVDLLIRYVWRNVQEKKSNINDSVLLLVQKI